MATNIRGNNDGKNGENESYVIKGRGTVSRKQLVNEVKNGQHPSHHVFERGGKEYVRANPDDKEGNNVNQ